MINLTTGAPGAGKTLFTLYYVEQLRQKEGRDVYYSGINNLKLPWIELPDPAKWYEVPAGSIVVIDECQRLFRPRATGSQVPEYVSRLETHRHAGIDLFLITQHPMLVETNVRRLVGAHRHVVRTFGMNRCTVHEWSTVKEQCDKVRTDSVRTELAYPKEVFGWYESAEVHTVKRRVPARVWLLGVLPFVLVGLGWGAYQGFSRYSGDRPVQEASGPIVGPRVPGAAPGVPVRGAVVHQVDWLAARVPRVPGLPHTAPVYDGVTAPTDAPYPAACMANANRCDCFTQQATRLQLAEAVCREIVAKGFFMDWKSAVDGSREAVAPVAAIPSAPVEPEPMIFGHTGARIQ